MPPKEMLLVFDFDQTIIHQDSDEVVTGLHPLPSSLPEPLLFPTHVDYMASVFQLLHASGVSKLEILNVLEGIPFTHGFQDLFSFLSRLDTEVIIISDSNQVFIEHFLTHHRLRPLFSTLFTNDSHFDHQERLHLRHFHHQSSCCLSSSNLCKGRVLDEFVEKRRKEDVEFRRVVYVGDGSNDYCPSLRLSSRDVILPRRDYDLERMLSEGGAEVKAAVLPWLDGFDIVRHLKLLLCAS